MQNQVLRGAHGQVGHNKLVKMDYVKQPYVQQGIGKEDFAREYMYKPYVEEKKLGKVIRDATITVDAIAVGIIEEDITIQAEDRRWSRLKTSCLPLP